MSLDPAIVATALDIVLEAGAIQAAHYGRHVRVSKKGAIDLVTEVDLEIERQARAVLVQRFPSHAILGEESGGAEQAPEGYCWVLDPLDGTTNFAHGVPFFCVSLGLERDGEAVYAAVYDALRKELYTAERGEGAFLNGERLQVSDTDTLIDSLLCTGFPYDVHTQLNDLVSLFGAFLGKARAVRRLGSAALDLCYVACGRLDGFWEARLKPWDTSAGALIVSEAGGKVTRWDGSPYQSRHETIVATNDSLHDELLGIIATHVARRHPD